jgi:ribose transport system permease protein
VKRGLTFGFDRFSGLYLWATFIIVFAVWTPETFLTSGTAQSIAQQQSIVAMMAIALLLPLSAGAYDLSIGAVVNFSAILVTVLQTQRHWGMWAAILFCVAMCAVIGAVNGFLVVKVGISSFIATLATASVILAVQEIVSGQSQPLPPISKAWTNLTQQKIFGYQIIVLYMLVLAVIIWWLLAHTPVGRYIYATGGNYEAARLSGVRVEKWTWLSMIGSSTICGIAGVLYCSLNGPSLNFGPGLLLPAFAAAFLGQTQIKPGRFNVLGALIAVYVLATGVKGLQLVTSVQWLPDMFNGVALAVAVGFAVWNQRRVKGSSWWQHRRGATPGDENGAAAGAAQAQGAPSSDTAAEVAAGSASPRTQVAR